MKVTGKMLIGGACIFGTAGTVRAFDPTLGMQIDPPFGAATTEDVNHACILADEAYDSYRSTSPEIRSAFLDSIADNLLELDDALYERAAAETGLTRARLKSEAGRTAAQLRMFADVVRQGRWRQATIDSADAARKPLPRVDLRMQKISIGPVGVFGASNFPILYSVAGGDTASALAAGCPVIVKAHGSHLGTSELVGRAIQKAVKDSGLHEGVFSLLIGAGNETGESLVDHPLIKAVGFTGSEGGGMALVRRGAQRAEPIPVFAEMTSVNPNFVLPGALKARASDIAARFVDQMTSGVGQMCLKPGMILAIERDGFDDLRSALSTALAQKSPETMLSPGISEHFARAAERTRTGHEIVSISKGPSPEKQYDGQSEIFELSGEALLADPKLAQEMFGPAGVLVRCASVEQLVALAASFQGQLTMSLHTEPPDHEVAKLLIPILERKTNRILFNKFANQVEIGFATIHGGPYPATSDSRFTSVGATAIDRFLRPVCYENMPSDLLPLALQDSNPLSLWRVTDGTLSFN
ncbi:aldehyde dehydrogenase (NADP(+)) [Caballeronia sp. 15715]|uniref:aldehyde dehydrogenase (NADP(+)) n=1 Tax=Caballeronia sp. 15715 TaxID=3391030 RepID=UPI0039E4A7B8